MLFNRYVNNDDTNGEQRKEFAMVMIRYIDHRNCKFIMYYSSLEPFIMVIPIEQASINLLVESYHSRQHNHPISSRIVAGWCIARFFFLVSSDGLMQLNQSAVVNLVLGRPHGRDPFRREIRTDQWGYLFFGNTCNHINLDLIRT